MKIVIIEGYVNDRVREVFREVFETENVPIVGYCQEGGWWTQIAYEGDRELTSDDVRKMDMDAFLYEETITGENPVALLLEEPNYQRIYPNIVQIHGSGGQNSYDESFQLLGWVIGGNEEDVEDVYQL